MEVSRLLTTTYTTYQHWQDQEQDLVGLSIPPSPTSSSSTLEPAATSAEPNPPPRSRSPMHNCVICTDEISGEEAIVACGHYYDRTCLSNLYRSVIKDESLFPPQCCYVPIDLDLVKDHLPSSLVALYLEKEVEYKTSRRVYCASPTCSRFLGAKDTAVQTVRSCTAPGCLMRTCGTCNANLGTGLTGQIQPRHTCKLDKGAKYALAIGGSRGWVRCPGCEELVERSNGCFHMTCRCRTQFCYVCRALWKSCKCTRWTARAAAVRRQPLQAVVAIRKIFWSAPSAPAAPAPAPIADCLHVDVSGRHVGRRCQSCQVPFIRGYRCTMCQMAFCQDCKSKLNQAEGAIANRP